LDRLQNTSFKTFIEASDLFSAGHGPSKQPFRQNTLITLTIVHPVGIEPTTLSLKAVRANQFDGNSLINKDGIAFCVRNIYAIQRPPYHIFKSLNKSLDRGSCKHYVNLIMPDT
jgi:hypothetical protein